MAKWKPVTFAELVAKKAERVFCVQCEDSPNGSSGGATVSPPPGIPVLGAMYSEAWMPESNGGGLTDGATFQGK